MTKHVPEYCEKCEVKLEISLDGEIYCPNCGLIYYFPPFIKQFLNDYQQTHIPPNNSGKLGTNGTPQMDLSIVKDEKGQERVMGALWLERWRKQHSSLKKG
jgi:transcription initiation factor TFIIIB Brf1 subunit/transcription initiation factor TFIIB